MTPEIRPIPGFPDYGASEDGRVWRIRSHSQGGYRLQRNVPYEMAQSHVGAGKKAVTLSIAGIGCKRSVGPLVAAAWLPGPIGRFTRQKDGKAGFAASNLEWVGQPETET